MRRLLPFLFLSLSFIATGCEKEQIISTRTSTEVIQDVGGAGNFKAINMATNDTLMLSGTIITVGGTPKSLTVRSGNIVKLLFEPADKYKDYKFESTFKLHDGSEVSGPVYEYVTKGISKGDYTITLSAQSANQQTSSDENTIVITQITSIAEFTLNVIE